jgi:trehalose 6-phosphate synthase/phosphatase
MAKLILVSNRLPITVEIEGNRLDFKASAGGLATGLSSFYKERNAIWIGWPGNVSQQHHGEVRRRLSKEHRAFPVFIPAAAVERFYEGYANKTLWPLLHYFPMYTRYSAIDWTVYKEVNELFYQAVERVAEAGDQIWVHDYQLMLLPGLIRKGIPEAEVGFFLHIPFPPYDILRLLPQHKEILESLLGADLVGFHTYDYMDAFLSSVRQVLGHENTTGQITVGARVAEVDVFPMGIDVSRFASAAEQQEVQGGLDRLLSQHQDKRLIFSVSRLDYTKGIPQHLDGLDYLLGHYPQWRGKLLYFLTVVPSREKVERYAHLRREIDEQVGHINSKYADLEWAPIRYLYRSLPFPELITLYVAADVALVLPLRDGMNLVAKEYVAAQSARGGVLVLSETAGAAKELRQAIIVNPNSREEVAAALHSALSMQDDERQERMKAMSEWLARHDIRHWADRFLTRLAEATSVSSELRCQELDQELRRRLLEEYQRSRRRLLLLDYDGTLAPFADRPEEAVPSGDVLRLLRELGEDPLTEVVLVSGRERESLTTWFGDLPVTLIAEHGAWVKPSGQSWQPEAADDGGWKERFRPLLERYVERIPGSFVEEKTASLAWHYRMADIGSASIAARELIDGLTNLTANSDIGVLQGNKVVEVKNEQVTKGGYYEKRLAGRGWDFILAMGDDWTDESLFRMLPPDAWSIKVGFGPSSARFRLSSPQHVCELLDELSALKNRVR